ncbi:hypothetical protein E2C01_074280 [Portunus trituberculatus]|uniref:Uncharacterized protein n=1 Tax=Portunus trituberculatus TaxID=210409 RepID=A0A5B7ICT0_PORTR|nr:hypothetical protein [Portunus trituberculatus]
MLVNIQLGGGCVVDKVVPERGIGQTSTHQFRSASAFRPKGCVELPILADLSSESSHKPPPQPPCIFRSVSWNVRLKVKGDTPFLGGTSYLKAHPLGNRCPE